MGKRKTPFVEGEHYHVYNRGVEKRNIFLDQQDVRRFKKCLDVLNTTKPIGSLYRLSFKGRAGTLLRGQASQSRLVDIVCFALLPNHYHLLLYQRAENGVPLFMQRLGTAHAMYFNEKYERSGSLFQGKYKSIHVNTNEYLLRLSAYVNLNEKVHDKWEAENNEIVNSSWPEYIAEGRRLNLCDKKIILDQFADREEYRNFAIEAVANTALRRKAEKNESFRPYLLE